MVQQRFDLREAVKDMPSSQVEEVMMFYTNAILSVICSTEDRGYGLLAVALSLSSNHRKKASDLDREMTTKLAFYSLFLPKIHSEAALKAIGVERQLIIEEAVSILESTDSCLVPQQRHLELLLSDFSRFRGAVYERFHRMAKHRSSSYVWAKALGGAVVDKDDADQNFSMAALRAIDRFNSNSGTLASSMVNWMQNAQNSSFSMSLGESYSLTRTARKRVAQGSLGLNNRNVDIDTVKENEIGHYSPDEVVSEEYDDIFFDFMYLVMEDDRLREKWQYLFWTMEDLDEALVKQLVKPQ
jgi:hypothetical protein